MAALHAMMQQLATCIAPMLLVSMNSLQLAKAHPTMSYILLLYIKLLHHALVYVAISRVHIYDILAMFS